MCIADLFNDFACVFNVAKGNGQTDYVSSFDKENHPSISKIKEQNFGTDVFNRSKSKLENHKQKKSKKKKKKKKPKILTKVSINK